MSKVTEEELEFVEVRKHSPQWEVFCKGTRVALVTQRYIATPEYSVTLMSGKESAMDTRDEAIDFIIGDINTPQ